MLINNGSLGFAELSSLSHTAQHGWLFPRARATQLHNEENFKLRFLKGKSGAQVLIHPAWIACVPPPKQHPLGYNEPFKKINAFLITSSKSRSPNYFQNEQMNFLEPDRKTQERISDSCSMFQLWLQICLEVHNEKKPKWPNFAISFPSLGISVPCTKSEYLLTCLSVTPVGIWVCGSPPAAEGISHILLGVSNYSLHKTSISLKNKNSCTEAVSAHKSSLPVHGVIPEHSKSLQTTPKTTFSHETPSLCKVKCQPFRLNSFQGCFGKLKIHKTNVNSTPVTNISGKSFKNCVKNEKYFNWWDRALSSDVRAFGLKGDAKTITSYFPALPFFMGRLIQGQTLSHIFLHCFCTKSR